MSVNTMCFSCAKYGESCKGTESRVWTGCAMREYKYTAPERKRKRIVRYRLEVNFLSKDYENSALETSSPIYTLEEGRREYEKAIKQFCVDDPTIPARVHFWKYRWNGNELNPLTIAKNY